MRILPDRTEFGHLFKAVNEHTYYPYWKTTSGNEVIVIPPNGVSITDWLIFVVPTGFLATLRGENVEERAFCGAEGYSRQKI